MRAWVVWSAGLLAYIVAVLDRTTLGVAGLDAAKRFGATPAVLSTFVVLQLVVYAGAQIPAGLLLDRFGSKKMILSGGALMLAGQLAMAFTTTLPVAIAARAVVGLGEDLAFAEIRHASDSRLLGRLPLPCFPSGRRARGCRTRRCSAGGAIRGVAAGNGSRD